MENLVHTKLLVSTALLFYCKTRAVDKILFVRQYLMTELENGALNYQS